MARLQTILVRSLAHFPADVLDEITADGHVFASAAWFRLLESVDLAEITQGEVQLRFAVVAAGAEPVAVVPVLRARGAGVYFLYGLRRYFFEHWIEEAVRLNPNKREVFARIFTGVSAFRKLLELTGSPLDDALIVSSPMTFRSHVAIAPSSPAARREILNSLIGELKRVARRLKRPLWFLGVEGDEGALQDALRGADCEPVFLFHDNCIDLEGFHTFDEYLRSFRRTTRRAFERDVRRTEAAGISFRFVDSFDRHAAAFTELYTATYARYGAGYYRHPAWFWRKMHASLGVAAEAIVAFHDEQAIGFSLLLESRRRGEMWTYRIGRRDDKALAEIPYYFSLSFYGPIRRAIDLGYRRIWLGPASYAAKSVRGAQQVPLYSYFWFPRRWDRWTLRPYLQLFGRITRKQIADSIAPPDATKVGAKGIERGFKRSQ